MKRTVFVLGLLLVALPLYAQESGSEKIVTRWAKDVTPETAWQEYPRPTMVRSAWLNLNGLWEYQITPVDKDLPFKADGNILVPFAVESKLSGVQRTVGPDNLLTYRKTFTVPSEWSGQRTLLHFGAVDWETQVYVDGTHVGSHTGGYDPFSFDITPFLHQDSEHELVVKVWDPSNQGYQPHGKQVTNPRGIWYTAVTGIWQTAWLEAVPETYIRSIKLTPDVDSNQLKISVDVLNPSGNDSLLIRALADGKSVVEKTVACTSVASAAIEIPEMKLWSPDHPFLYDLQLIVRRADQTVDEVASYFGMRKIDVQKAEDGHLRLFLNDEALFQFGPLDQGWWPGGLYTSASDEALKYDVEATKQLGFNTLRKHVKVEPERFYYWCDKLGILVWQDMPSGDGHIGSGGEDLKRTAQSSHQFRRELKAMMDSLHNHPSIVMWVPFNEGWGQFETAAITSWIKNYDPSRLVNSVSGWVDRGTGDVNDVHSYPGPSMRANDHKRATVLGEFGGLGLALSGHTWQDEKNWGYRTHTTKESLSAAYKKLVDKLPYLIANGLSAAIYTQTSDVEIEVNGLMTYDREIIKMDPEWLASVNAQVYQTPGEIRTVLPTSEQEPATWCYTFTQPEDGWFSPEFDCSGWKQGEAGFGKPDTANAEVRTVWTTDDIWIRREFSLETTDYQHLVLKIFHDEDAEVYINGILAASLERYTIHYTFEEISEAAIKALRKGNNIIAIHCHQTKGGQFIDAGLVELIPREE